MTFLIAVHCHHFRQRRHGESIKETTNDDAKKMSMEKVFFLSLTKHKGLEEKTLSTVSEQRSVWFCFQCSVLLHVDG